MQLSTSFFPAKYGLYSFHVGVPEGVTVQKLVEISSGEAGAKLMEELDNIAHKSYPKFAFGTFFYSKMGENNLVVPPERTSIENLVLLSHLKKEFESPESALWFDIGRFHAAQYRKEDKTLGPVAIIWTLLVLADCTQRMDDPSATVNFDQCELDIPQQASTVEMKNSWTTSPIIQPTVLARYADANLMAEVMVKMVDVVYRALGYDTSSKIEVHAVIQSLDISPSNVADKVDFRYKGAFKRERPLAGSGSNFWKDLIIVLGFGLGTYLFLKTISGLLTGDSKRKKNKLLNKKNKK